MFGKLMKHELRQTGRTMLPMLGGYLVLALAAAGVNGLNVHFSASGAGPVLQILSALTLFLLILAVLALMVVVMVLCVQRFYRMLGDEGYLAFSLPVTPAQHIGAKLLCAVLWTLAALVAVAFSMFLQAVPFFFAAPVAVWESASPLPWPFILVLVLMALAGLSYVYLSVYLSCAVGGRWPNSRLAASVGVWVALNVALQVLVMVAVIAAALSPGLRASFLDLMSTVPQVDEALQIAALALGCWTVLLGALGAAYFFLTRWLLAKKLNLA